MKRQSAVLLAAAGVLALGRAEAGERTSIQGLGMARTYTAVSRGLDAAGINPANLDADSATVTLVLLPFGVHVGSDFLTYGLYTRYFTGVDGPDGRTARYLGDAEKQEILDAFPDGEGAVSADAEARPLGLAVHVGGLGTVALTMTERAAADVRIPAQYVRFLLYGNPPGSVYDFSATSGNAWWTREYALTVATTLHGVLGLPTVSVGIGGKLVHGYGVAQVTRFHSRLETGTDGVLRGTVDMESRAAGIDPIAGGQDYSPFPDPAGEGVGIDLGLAAQLSPLLRVGLSVTDIGSITWSRNVRVAKAESSFVVDNPADASQRDAIQHALQGDAHDGDPFTTPLPAMIRAGASVELDQLEALGRFIPGEMTVACDLDQTLAEAPGYLPGTRLALGMEWRPWRFLPVRAGYSWGGTDHQNFALGLGLHFGFFELDLASENPGWLFAADSFSYASASVGMKMRF
ncbi:MAG TPA: DUF5723 family protein [Bacteroidota bacterium]